MLEKAEYILVAEDGEHRIVIHPDNKCLPGGNWYATGIFRLTEGDVGIGDIVFDDDMKEWEYTGMGDLSRESAEEIAEFIRNYKEPEPEV